MCKPLGSNHNFQNYAPSSVPRSSQIHHFPQAPHPPYKLHLRPPAPHLPKSPQRRPLEQVPPGTPPLPSPPPAPNPGRSRAPDLCLCLSHSNANGNRAQDSPHPRSECLTGKSACRESSNRSPKPTRKRKPSSRRNERLQTPRLNTRLRTRA